MFNPRIRIYPPTPRKVRLLRDLSLIIVALQICYVLGVRTWLQSFPTPPAIVLALRTLGCQDSALAGFCTASAQQTAIGVIVPSVRILCLWGSFFIVPLAPLFLLTRSRQDALEVQRMRDAADARKRGLGIGFPLAALICMLGAAFLATLEPSLQLCQGAHFSLRAMLVRICPGETAFEALTIPVLHLIFNVTWSLFSYGWRPFHRLPDSAQNQAMGSDAPRRDESHRHALKTGDSKVGVAPSSAAQPPEPPRGFGRRSPTAPGSLPPVPSPVPISATSSTSSGGAAQATGPTQPARPVPTFGRKGLAPLKSRE